MYDTCYRVLTGHLSHCYHVIVVTLSMLCDMVYMLACEVQVTIRPAYTNAMNTYDIFSVPCLNRHTRGSGHAQSMPTE